MLTTAVLITAAKAAGVGFVLGAGGAARADYMAFKTWRSFHDVYDYDWAVAAWRWFQGGVVGAVGAVSGLGLLSTLQSFIR